MKIARYAVLVALGVVALAPPRAHADSFKPVFTCTGTCASLPTAPDVIAETNALFSPSWNGLLFGFIMNQIGGFNLTDTYTWTASIAPFAGSVFTNFMITDITIGGNTGDSKNCQSFPCLSTVPYSEAGSLTFSPTPEPSSLLLFGAGLLGLMAMGLYKKRLA